MNMKKTKNDKTGKYSLKAYIEIKCLMIHDDGEGYKNQYYTFIIKIFKI